MFALLDWDQMSSRLVIVRSDDRLTVIVIIGERDADRLKWV